MADPRNMKTNTNAEVGTTMKFTGHDEHFIELPTKADTMTTSRGDITAYAFCADCDRKVFLHFPSYVEMALSFSNQKVSS